MILASPSHAQHLSTNVNKQTTTHPKIFSRHLKTRPTNIYKTTLQKSNKSGKQFICGSPRNRDRTKLRRLQIDLVHTELSLLILMYFKQMIEIIDKCNCYIRLALLLECLCSYLFNMFHTVCLVHQQIMQTSLKRISSTSQTFTHRQHAHQRKPS